MKRVITLAPALAIGLSLAPQAQAQDKNAKDAPRHALGIDLFYSSDADNTEVIRSGVDADISYRDPDHYKGFRIEKAWYKPLGQQRTSDTRAYVRLADSISGWKWKATVGTDGDTVLGSASIHDESRYRKELFVEREKLETPLGVSRGIYYTYVGAAIDLPLDDRNVLTVLGGLQEFTGRNVRKVARASFVHVVKPDWGLSVQMRARYFNNSVPREFDYFSPRWYAEVLPVVQLRRFSGGWQYLAAAGWGAQRDSESGWRQSRYLNLRMTSPQVGRNWRIRGDFTYSNMPITNSPAYDYMQFTIGLTRAF